MPDRKIGVYQSNPIKLTMFDPAGTPAGDFDFKLHPDHSIQFLSRVQSNRDSFLVSGIETRSSAQKLDRVDRLMRFKADGSFECEMLAIANHMDFGKPVVRDDRSPYTVYSSAGDAFVADTWNYEITVKRRDCGTERVIAREFDHRKRTRAELEEIEAYYVRGGGTQGVTFDFSKFDADVRWMGISDNNRLWVLSSRGVIGLPEDSLGVFDVYDVSGRLLHEVELKAEGNPVTDKYIVAGGRFYVVRHNRAVSHDLEQDPEPVSVICYEFAGI
jgi:hypothetical protein